MGLEERGREENVERVGMESEKIGEGKGHEGNGGGARLEGGKGWVGG